MGAKNIIFYVFGGISFLNTKIGGTAKQKLRNSGFILSVAPYLCKKNCQI
jgi:hypothetical protein